MFTPTIAVGRSPRSNYLRVVFVLLRMLGKEHVGEMAPFDLVILRILSESVSWSARPHEERMQSPPAAMYPVTPLPMRKSVIQRGVIRVNR